jgi:hypothetical protein
MTEAHRSDVSEEDEQIAGLAPPSGEEGEGADRRVDIRHLACFPAHVETSEGVPRSALIRDLSVSGALLLTRASLQVGDPVKLALYLGDEPEPYPAQGRVVREERRIGERAHPWTKSVAVQFDAPLTELEPQIKALAERQAALFGRNKATK